MLDKTLLDIIVCPNCKGPLIYSYGDRESQDRESQELSNKEPVDVQSSMDRLICQAEKLAYPVRDGIPVLLVDEAQLIETADEPRTE